MVLARRVSAYSLGRGRELLVDGDSFADIYSINSWVELRPFGHLVSVRGESDSSGFFVVAI